VTCSETQRKGRKERCTKSLAVALSRLARCFLEETRGNAQRSKQPRPKQAAGAGASSKPSKQQQHQQQPESSQSSTTISSSTTFRQPQLQLPCTTVRLLGYPHQHPALRLFTPDATSVPPRASSLHAPPRPLRLPPLLSPSASLSKRMLE
jgi:cytoskeletal protein RodZ